MKKAWQRLRGGVRVCVCVSTSYVRENGRARSVVPLHFGDTGGPRRSRLSAISTSFLLTNANFSAWHLDHVGTKWASQFRVLPHAQPRTNM